MKYFSLHDDFWFVFNAAVIAADVAAVVACKVAAC
jgi:hypothetical protein